MPELGLTRDQRVLAGYAAWMVLLVVSYYWVPGLRAVTWGLIGLSGVATTVAGVAVHRPVRKAPWLLLAGANLSFIAGQLGFLIAQQAGTGLPFPSFADVLYLLEYPLYAAGVLVFIRWLITGIPGQAGPR